MGPLGLSGMGFPFKISSHRELGHPPVSGDIFKCLPLAPPLLLLHFVPTFLFDCLSTGCLGITFLLLPVCTIIVSHLQANLLYILWYSSHGGLGTYVDIY